MQLNRTDNYCDNETKVDDLPDPSERGGKKSLPKVEPVPGKTNFPRGKSGFVRTGFNVVEEED